MKDHKLAIAYGLVQAAYRALGEAEQQLAGAASPTASLAVDTCRQVLQLSLRVGAALESEGAPQPKGSAKPSALCTHCGKPDRKGDHWDSLDGPNSAGWSCSPKGAASDGAPGTPLAANPDFAAVLELAAFFQDDYNKKLPVIAACRRWRNGTTTTEEFLKCLGADDVAKVLLNYEPVAPLGGLMILNDHRHRHGPR